MSAFPAGEWFWSGGRVVFGVLMTCVLVMWWDFWKNGGIWPDAVEIVGSVCQIGSRVPGRKFSIMETDATEHSDDPLTL